MSEDLIKQAQAAVTPADLDAIQDPTPAFSMDAFVVGQHDMPGQQWAQSVVELQNRLLSVAISDIDTEIALIKIDALEDAISRKEAKQRIRKLKANKIRLELTSVNLARLGTVRGIGHLLKIKARLEESNDGKGWTRDDLDRELPEYWRRRLSRQAALDLNATGRIGVGNQDALRMAGMEVPGLPTHVQAVEQRFLEVGKAKILVAIPTLIDRDVIQRDGLKCLQGWRIPEVFERRIYVVQGKSIADAYSDAALTAMADGCTHLLCVEDDHVIPQGTFEKIWDAHQQRGPRSIVGAWYPQKCEPRTGAPIIVRNGHRDYLGDGLEGLHAGRQAGGSSDDRRQADLQQRHDSGSHDGGPVEVYTVPQGFTLIPTSIFREIPQPWFVTTDQITQDSFFSQLAREAGYKLLVDTSARIKHVCRDTGRVYE